MPYIGQVKEYDRINFLASQNFQAFTALVTAASVTDPSGVLKAGTVWPANDATAQGIVFSDVDVSNGDQPASIVVAGFILEDRLPVAPSAAAKTALNLIQFR